MKGRPERPLPRDLLPCFKWALVDVDEERRAVPDAPAEVARRVPYLQAGVRTMAQLRRAFSLGAVAVVGWPLHEPLAEALQASPAMRVVMDAIERLDRGDRTESVDHVLMRDPVLAFELLSHLGGAAPLQIETESVRHAVTVVGHDNLRRWLALLLQRSADEVRMRPANFAALRRGLLMRMLADAVGQREARGELFICGVFSLLERIYARPVGELVQHLALPDRVQAALVRRSGPFAPLLELARAIESEDAALIRAAASAVFLQPIEINRALMRSLLVAAQLERPSQPSSSGRLGLKSGLELQAQLGRG